LSSGAFETTTVIGDTHTHGNDDGGIIVDANHDDDDNSVISESHRDNDASQSQTERNDGGDGGSVFRSQTEQKQKWFVGDSALRRELRRLSPVEILIPNEHRAYVISLLNPNDGGGGGGGSGGDDVNNDANAAVADTTADVDADADADVTAGAAGGAGGPAMHLYTASDVVADAIDARARLASHYAAAAVAQRRKLAPPASLPTLKNIFDDDADTNGDDVGGGVVASVDIVSLKDGEVAAAGAKGSVVDGVDIAALTDGEAAAAGALLKYLQQSLRIDSEHISTGNANRGKENDVKSECDNGDGDANTEATAAVATATAFASPTTTTTTTTATATATATSASTTMASAAAVAARLPLRPLRQYTPASFLVVDESARAHLEIIEKWVDFLCLFVSFSSLLCSLHRITPASFLAVDKSALTYTS
jgi:hypothetical protein